MLREIPNSIHGLSSDQVLERQARGLTNAVAFKTGRSYLGILRKNIFTFINTMLFTISTLLVLMGQADDAFVTAGLVLLNVLVGTYQEARAKYKLDRLALQVRAEAKVVRDGEERSIDPDEVVMGDILICHPGDQIVADGRMIAGNSIAVDESNLTGESERIYKRPGDPIYSGSFCTSGTGLYEVEKVGAESGINKLTSAARAFRVQKTPLQRDIDTIIRVLVVLVTFLGVLLGVSTLLSGVPLVEYIRIGAVIVALVPQGLFFMTTTSYAMGMLRVAAKGALIQEANAVESTSHVDLLCLDKTGTLTTGRLQLSEVIPIADPIMPRHTLLSILGEFAASMGAEDGVLSALLIEKPAEPRPVIERVPFSADYRWSALRFAESEAEVAYVLGAPEVLSANLPANDELSRKVKGMMAQARRVLLFASSPGSTAISEPDGRPQLPANLEPLGLLVFQEEVRPEARQTLDHFRELGVKIKIVSGDSPDTVSALVHKIGLQSGRVVSGMDLEEMGDARLKEVAEQVTVFGRFSPRQKERLVEIYREHGYYTSMIGDGVNDILPLKRAHLGVAMQSGAPATRSIADIILMEDRFSILPEALEEGQRIVRGMKDVIRLLLTRTFYVFFLIIGAQIAGAPFPITPKHNALIALLTVGIPILAIAAWAKGGHPPGKMLRATLRFVFPAAITISFLLAALYLAYITVTGDVDLARTALTAASVCCGLLLLPFVEPPVAWWVAGDELSGDPRPSLLAVAMLALFAIVMGVPELRRFFELVALGWRDYLIIIALVAMWVPFQRMIWRNFLLERLLGLAIPSRDSESEGRR